jgi:heat shock protein HtpX
MYKEIESNKRNSIILMMIFIFVLIGIGLGLDYFWGEGSYSIVWVAIIISLLMTSVSYFKGDKIALASTGAKKIKKEENTYVYRLVENLCITAGLAMPQIYIIEDPAINAFATGRDPNKSSIALTRGAIEKLENEELEGVIAHELSHIKNYDIRFMTMVAVLVGSIVLISDIFIRSQFLGNRRQKKDKDGSLFLIIGIVLAILSPIIAEIIKLAISRKREYLADASASLLTRYPTGLANALEKIKNENLKLIRSSKATAPLFISSPFNNKSKKVSWFSTHPPIENRIAKLKRMI